MVHGKVSPSVKLPSKAPQLHQAGLLDTLLKRTTENIYFWDVQGHYLRINQSAARHLGLRNPRAVVGKSAGDFFTKQYASKVNRALKKIIASGRPSNETEEAETWLNGRTTWTMTSRAPLRDDHGRIYAILEIGHDITRHKQLEMAFSREQTLLHALLDNVPDTIYFKDAKSRYLRISKAKALKHGFKNPDQAIGKTDFDFFTKKHARQAFTDEKTIMKTRQPIIGLEEKETWPDGRETWVSTTKMPLLDEQGQVIGTFGISRDITRRKLAEIALENEKNMLRTVIDNIPDKIYAKDLKGRFLLCNQAVATRMGTKDPADITGKSDFDFLPRALARQFHNDEQAIIRSGQPLVNHVEPLNHAAATKKWNLTTKVPLRDKKGKIIGIVGLGRDITAQKQAEEEREKVILELQEALKKVNTLKGLIPICAACKKIRDDRGYWNSVETYLAQHSDAAFTHGICPDCMRKLYPDYVRKKEQMQGSGV